MAVSYKECQEDLDKTCGQKFDKKLSVPASRTRGSPTGTAKGDFLDELASNNYRALPNFTRLAAMLAGNQKMDHFDSST
jgi:hypothetical protein